MKLGKRIADLRKAQGMTQAQLAEKLGITDKAVSKWERGLSNPDVTLLPDVAAKLEVNVGILLGETEASGESFISLEKYYMGRFGFVVPDHHPAIERVTLILDFPDLDDAKHGVPLSGVVGEEFSKYLFDMDEAPTRVKLSELGIGVTYVSNVPLWNLDPSVESLVDELEFTRLNKYHIDRFLLDGFIKKLESLVFTDTVKTIALTREFNQKYFGAFLSYASPKTLSHFFGRLYSGDLRILFVSNPRFWNKPDAKKYPGLAELKKKIVNYS